MNIVYGSLPCDTDVVSAHKGLEPIPLRACCLMCHKQATTERNCLSGSESLLVHCIRQKAPRKEVLQSVSQEYMRTIKAKHHEEEMNRRDRKARRRQALAQQQSKLQVLSASSHLLREYFHEYRDCNTCADRLMELS